MIEPSLFMNSFYIGINVENVLYGIELGLYFKTISVLLSNNGTHKKSNLFYVLFSSVMVFSITIWVATKALFGQQMWILRSSYPGGADAYWDANAGVWYMNWATVMVIMLQLMTDALMIYRCRIVWNSYRIIAIPIVLWVGTLSLGVLVTCFSSLPGGSYYNGITHRFSLAYWSVSVFLNTTLTCMICYRIMRHGRRVQECLGDEYASLYFVTFTIVVESVLPYTLCGIAFLVALGIGSPTSTAFISVYLLMMCISPQMLILRVMLGEAWSHDTFSRPSTIRFGRGDTSGSQNSRIGVHPHTPSNVYNSGSLRKVRFSEF